MTEPVTGAANAANEAIGPLRTCIGCRARKPQVELIRIAVHDGEIRAQDRGFGRGAWLCPQETCVEHAGRSKAFSRAFRTKLADRVCADTLLGWLGKSAP